MLHLFGPITKQMITLHVWIMQAPEQENTTRTGSEGQIVLDSHIAETQRICYVMPTSGSTGDPLGVCGTEQGT